MIAEPKVKIAFQAERFTHFHDLESQIGNTPLLRLRRVAQELPAGVEIFVKAEHMNPGGSVKDRAALAMILEGERTGRLYPGKVILDATSGNTGIAYIIETDPLQGSDGAQTIARDMATRDATKYFYADQYNNDANWRAHHKGTGREIWEQTQGRVTHFVAGLGTCGTFTGVVRKLKELDPTVRAISMEPDSPIHGLEGLKHLPTSRMPGIFDPKLADETVEVATEEAQAMTRRLAREEGLFVGVSSGANVLAALSVARRLPPGSVVVTILCDGGERYFSERFWTE
ncbi:MAG: cysteine synthase [Acidobacteria bacterium]|nr:MAG: cysteine synthase [Acidobacteriota bacterium]